MHALSVCVSHAECHAELPMLVSSLGGCMCSCGQEELHGVVPWNHPMCCDLWGPKVPPNMPGNAQHKSSLRTFAQIRRTLLQLTIKVADIDSLS